MGRRKRHSSQAYNTSVANVTNVTIVTNITNITNITNMAIISIYSISDIAYANRALNDTTNYLYKWHSYML